MNLYDAHALLEAIGDFMVDLSIFVILVGATIWWFKTH